MPDDKPNATSCTLSPEQIIAAAAKWGRTHGRLWASLEGVREAVLAGEEVDWCDWPEVFWDDIGVSTEDMLPLLSEELQQAGEHAAWVAAKAEGERCCRKKNSSTSSTRSSPEIRGSEAPKLTHSRTPL